MTQLQFLDVLNHAARAQGRRVYTQSTLSKLESGSQSATFDDVAVFAAVDPLSRGKLWLGWGEEALPQIRPASDSLRTHDEASARALTSKTDAAAKKGAAAGHHGSTRRTKRQ